MKRFFLFSLSCAAFAFSLFDSVALADVFKASKRLAGFSPDSRYYIYLESYQNSVTEVPTAQIQIIDLRTNSCVKDGCLKTEYDRSDSNLTNRAAEDDLLKRTLPIRQALKLTQLKVGIQLPIISHSSKPDATQTETVQVRLPNETQPLQIFLQQRSIPSFSPGGASSVDRAAMRLVLIYNSRRLTLGDLNNYREAVQKYAIREVRLSPDGSNVVILMDMTQPTYEGVWQTTLLQSFRI
jgi:predicted secreted protein